MKRFHSHLLITLILTCFTLLESSLFAQNANFTASDTTICGSGAVTFTATGSNVANYSWVFGNGQTGGNFVSVTTTYSLTGNYTTTLYITYTNGLQDTITKPNFVEVFTPPTANFTASPLQICVGQSVQFTSTSITGSGVVTNYLWDFGDGNSSSATNPSHIYNLAGTFPVALIITDVNGCTDNIVQSSYITVVQPPSAVFTVNPTISCNTTTPINFVWTGPGGFTHSWNFGPGQGTSTAASPSHVYTVNGTYTVSHTITTTSGCTTTYTLPNAVQVGQTPPSINTTGTQFCTGQPINVQWQQVALNTISWNSGGGTPATSTAISPTFTYATPGTYTITATMTDTQTGCSSNSTLNVNVQNSPSVSFSSTTNLACEAPHTVSFTSNAPGATSYSWNFGDGTPTSTQANPSHVYNATGTFNVSLTVTNSSGCSATYQPTPAFVQIVRPVALFTALPNPQGCVPYIVDFQDQSTSTTPIVSWEWDFGTVPSSTSNLQNPTFTYNAVGNYTVVLIITNADGCKDTLVKTNYIKVGTPPIVNFTATPTDTCGAYPISFTSSSVPLGQSYWQFGLGQGTGSGATPSYTYTDTGYFDVTLIVNNQGCRDTLVKPNYIHIEGPIVKFSISPSQSCSAPVTVTITNQSVAATYYTWDFGDGSLPDYSQNPPPHTYTVPGTYTITLNSGSTTTGCTDVYTQTFIIDPPQAVFAANITQSCAPDSVFFFNLSTNSASCVWDFGDGGTSTVCNPVHTYLLPGIYTVILTTTNSIGCQLSDTIVNYINMNGLNVAFTVDSDSGCNPLTVQFTDQTLQTVPITQWNWNFSNGTSTQQNPMNIYNGGGMYDVTLSVTDQNGCVSTHTETGFITVFDPQVTFTANYPINCIGNPVSFTSNVVGANAASLYYSWTFGDGSSSTVSTPTPTHIYSANGSYMVSLTITDPNGCTNTYTQNNYITISSLTADFSTPGGVTAACPPFIANFSPLSSPPFSPLNLTYSWTFGDGGASIINNPSHIYILPGDYTVGMVITDASGCTASITETNLIHIDGPIATYTITPNETCPYIPISFTAIGTNVVQYHWNFGDGVSQQQNPTHSYVTPGQYIPTLTVVDGAGCTVLMPQSDTVLIHVPPIANFGVDSTFACVPANVVFTDSSTFTDGNLSTWVWTYGDGNTGANNPSPHTYTTPGYVDITMVVTDEFGCKDTLTKNDLIYLIPNNQPYQPIIYTASVVHDDSVEITFSAYKDIVGDFGQYRIFRSVGGGAPILVATVQDIQDTIIRDFAPAANTQPYCYTLNYVNHCGNMSANSVEHCTIDLSTTSLIDTIQLMWTPYSAWQPPLKYYIYRNTTYSSGTLIDSVPGTQLIYKDFRVDCNTYYSYRIKAKESGTSWKAWGDTAGVMSLHFTTLNPVETSLATVEQNKNIRIKWKIPNSVTKVYVLQIEKRDLNVQNSTFQQLAAFPIPFPTDYVDMSQNLSHNFEYRTFVLDSCGDKTPIGNVATNIVAKAKREGDGILISWSPYRDWVDGVDFYRIELKNEQNMPYTYVQVADVPGSDTFHYELNKPIVQSQNCYRIKAYKKYDNQTISLSNEACTGLSAEVIVPNAFTPNGDNINDEFALQGTFIKNFEMYIYDRWGAKVFESHNIENSWDGEKNGHAVPEGTYMYRGSVTGYSGVEKEFHGSLILIR